MRADLSKVEKALVIAYEAAKQEYELLYPDRPKVVVTHGHRSEEEQAALYAQGRQTLAEVNALRAMVKWGPIKAEENKNKVTYKKFGTSKHNLLPSKAIDIAFVDKAGAHWDVQMFRDFAKLIGRKNRNIKWGGKFPTFIDNPHFEL